jgi:hypothetical protein
LAQKITGFLFFAGISLVLSCSTVHIPQGSIYKSGQDTMIAPDYSKLENWAANPDKWDPSDSIPLPLQDVTLKDTGVDVFFLYPTTLTSGTDPRWNANIDDAKINEKTDYSTILFQASAFDECRLFAPRYRQAHVRAYFTGDTAAANKAFDLAYSDIKSAFQYYLDHYNHGRPVIIASHSQGTTHAKRLLKEFFDNGPLKNKLVAAYIIGMPLPRNYFSALSPCTDSTQTGCFVGWRTYLEGYEPEYIQKEDPRSYVVNPLTWTTTEAYAPRDLNQGAVVFTKDFNKVVYKLVDAQVHDGVLWVHRPHFPGSFLYRSKNYHIGDINLFYVNIRNNVRTRIHYYRMQKT